MTVLWLLDNAPATHYAIHCAMKHALELLVFGMFVLFNRMAMLVPVAFTLPAFAFALRRPALPATALAEMASRRNPRFTLLVTEPHAAP
jgi:hypothetical protein